MQDWEPTLVLAEYNTLRGEILKREEIRYQLIALTVTGFGLLLAFGSQTQNATSLLFYPVLALCIAIAWRSNHQSIWKLSDYIIDHIESKSKNNLNWESYSNSLLKRQKTDRYLTFGSKGIFVLTDILALIIGVIVGLSQQRSNNIVFVFISASISVLVIIATVYLLSYTRKMNDHTKLSNKKS